mmetsp:Transcript_3009/g.8697  ORF Transcript_3009/g.8697 Transcript_3009/m.8697 type:complete len:229 (-) Transcript_3009:283-969(-)
MLIQLTLDFVHVQIVQFGIERVLEFTRQEVQRPEGEHQHEREKAGPDDVLGPRTNHDRRDESVDHQEKLKHCSVGEGKRHPRELQRPVVLLHGCSHLLEGTREQGRRNAQNTALHTIHHLILEPLEDNFRLVFAHRQLDQILSVDTRNVNELATHGPLVLHVLILQLAVDHCIQEAYQPNHLLLKFDDEIFLGQRVAAEGEQRTDYVEPVPQGFESQICSFPESRVRL